MFSSNEKYQWCLLGYKESNITKSQHYTICSSKPKSTLYPISSGKIPSATFLSPFESPESIANVRLLWGLKVQNNDANLMKKTAYTTASTQYPFLIFFFYHDQLAHAKKHASSNVPQHLTVTSSVDNSHTQAKIN